MAGLASCSRDADVAASARAALDEAAERIAVVEDAQRSALESLISLWPTSAWKVAGAVSAKAWLLAYTTLSDIDASRLERVAQLCARNRQLAAAVLDGTMSLGQADRLARSVTPERARFLDRLVDPLLDLVRSTSDPSAFRDALAYWVERVDERLAPRRVQTQSLVFSERLFGGGDIHGSLTPVSFAHVRAAVDALTQDPDPTDAPYQRTLSERRADALDDMAMFTLTHEAGTDEDVAPEDEAIRADDTYDGSYPGDSLDEALLPENEHLDGLELLRSKLRKAEEHQRRRRRRQTRPRSGARVNVHMDLRTMSGTRDATDLEDLVLRGDGWTVTRSAAEQILCDSALVATLFDGKTKVLDANTSSERFSRADRRAIEARDRHCVFPSCTRPPRHCDTHHLHERQHGGPTSVANGCLQCGFHHTLLHNGWSLFRDCDGVWTARDPHGVEWKGRPTNPAAA